MYTQETINCLMFILSTKIPVSNCFTLYWGEPERAPYWSVVKVYVGASHCAWSVKKKNPIEKPFKFCICWSITLCAECERYTGYSINTAFVYLRTSHARGSIMASDVRRETNEDRLGRRIVMCDTYRNIEISQYSWCIGIRYSHACVSIFL